MASFGPDLDLSGVVANLAVLHPVVLSIEAKLRRTGKGKRLLIENGSKAEFNADLAAMITETFAILNQLLSGSDTSIEAMTDPPPWVSSRPNDASAPDCPADMRRF